MADFIAVIRRAVDGLSNNTPEMRAKVYEKARAAVVRQLENMSPRPPEQMLQRQLSKLDAAILEVEAEHAEALPAADEALPDPVLDTAIAAEHPAWSQDEPEAEASVETDAAAGYHEPDAVADDATEAEPTAPSASGDDWADAHMADERPLEPVETPVVEVADADEAEPYSAPQVWEEPAYAAAEEPHAEIVEAPDYYAPAVDDEPFASEPEQEPVPEPVLEPAQEPEHHYETPVAGESDAPEVVVDEPRAWRSTDESASLIWDEESHETPAVAAATYENDDVARAPVVDAVDDWLADRNPALSQPVIPPASWDLADAGVERPAFDPHELPEVAAEPSAISFAPASGFPAYDPERTETTAVASDPHDILLGDAAYASESVPAHPAKAESEDFSQWFNDTAGDLSKVPPTSVEAAAVLPAAGEWDDQLSTFSTHAEGEAVEPSGEPDAYGAYRLEPKKPRNFAPLIFGVLGAVLVVGGGFAAWTYRDEMGAMVSSLTGSSASTTDTAATTPVVSDPATTPAATTEQPATTTPPPAATTEDGAAVGQKFTQRLLADGTETDAGAGATVAADAPAEGRSVSAQTLASTVEPGDAPPSTAPAPTQNPPAVGSPATAVSGDKAFLYEEKLGQTSPVAVPGTISWSAVRETGEDGKPNPQIQGRINVPERGMSALVTIKRNADSSLPASHIIEVVFSVPPDFEGGAIENLQRIAMKRTEQDRGDPLVAVSAKVTDDTYLVALNDFEDVVKRNLDLLATRGWIDIPVIYRNGRRALLTLDKGTDGAAVFTQVMKEWAALAAPAGN
ncbi:hypothetical protein [Rhizobium sp. 18065]|uniref:hypothetical protein n=1 Tax=Rhizobium sp. 18065 TaxID=2681411 RepID=UPI001358C19D|nr:hypothetical protein [Rhizobium sp. 18065]